MHFGGGWEMKSKNNLNIKVLFLIVIIGLFITSFLLIIQAENFDDGNMIVEKDSEYCAGYYQKDIARRECEDKDMILTS